MKRDGAESPAEDEQEQAQPAGPIVHTSEELLAGRKEAFIEHQGQLYRLRVTSKGNLILTK